MKEPWNLKSDDTRIEDYLPIFIIFCEDEVSEPIYFKFFETNKIKINCINNQKSKVENVLKAITHCLSEDLMEYKDGLLTLKDLDTQIWCVFDRDLEETIEKVGKGNVEFNESISTAENRGIKVAWSNDAFELWILLHFESIEITNNEYKNREKYYERLTEIFKNHPNPNSHLNAALKYHNFNYKDSLKSRNNFRFIVREEIIKHTKDAIERASSIYEYHQKKSIPDHEKNPCTLVHKLVIELLKHGEKNV